MKQQHKPYRVADAKPRGWSQLITPNMTPVVASILMGVPLFVAENELQRARTKQSIASRIDDAVGGFLHAVEYGDIKDPQPLLVRMIENKRMTLDEALK